MNTDATDKKNLLYREKLAKSLQDLSAFQRFNKALFQKLFEKGLSIKKSDGIYFFENVYEILAVTTEKSVKAADKIRQQVCRMARTIGDWSKIDPDFAFLNQRPDILAALIENPDSPIFTGFILLLMCRWHCYLLKVYQLQEGNSLVSAQLGGDDCFEFLRMVVLVSPYGPRFALLDKLPKGMGGQAPTVQTSIQNIPKSLSELSPLKISNANDRGSFEIYLESITNFEIFSSQVRRNPQKELTNPELQMLRTIVDNIGICPQFFIDYSEYLRYKEFIQMAKKELSFLFHNIVKSVSQKSCQNIELLTTKNSEFETYHKQQVDLPLNITSFANFTQVIDSSPNQFQKPAEFRQPVQNGEAPSEPPIVPSMANLPGIEIYPGEGMFKGYKRHSSFDLRHSLGQLGFTQQDPSALSIDERRQLIYSNASLAQSYDPASALNRSGQADPYRSVLSFGNKEMFQISRTASVNEGGSRKPVVLEQNSANRASGALKFYNEQKKFGFIIKDDDKSDVFFHLTDMELGGITENALLTRKDLKFSFVTMKYVGKKTESKKAVELKLLY